MPNPKYDHDTLMDWLRDAHAMEKQALTMMERQADRAKDAPDLERRLREHIIETRDQERWLRERIEALGGSTSAVKTGFGKLMGTLQPALLTFAEDEVVKQALAAYAFENLEIASYKSLISACDHWGDKETRAICQRILEQEEAMARWLDEHVDGLTQEFLDRKAKERAAAK